MRHLVVIFAVFLVSATAAVPRISRMLASFDVKPVEAVDDDTCKGVAAGDLTCSSDCTQLVTCRADGTYIGVETCPTGEICLGEECIVSEAECQQGGAPITCTDRGIFPDPYDCTMYHWCSGEGVASVVQPCSDDYAFDSTTATCRNWLNDTICNELPISCSKIGASAIFPENPTIYYVCASNTDGQIYPVLYKCYHGEIYNNKTYLCEDGRESSPEPSSNDSSGTTSITSSNDSPGTTSATTSDATPPTNPPTTTPLTNAPTTTPPTNAPTTTPPTNAPTTTPPTNAPTTTPAPSEDADCSPILQVVPDPVDCTRYYQCLPTEKWFRGDCIPDFYFDREQKKCLYGPCPYE